MNSLVARSLRWVLWDESFRDYDYLYTIDIDMFYIREPQELMEQHIEHMNYIGSDCVSNFRRINVIRKTPFEIMRMFKWGGIRGVIDMLKTDRVNRMSGLHFVKVKEYYEHITPEILHKYRSIIYANKIMRLKPLISCEPLLYDMMEEGGIDMSVFGVQSSVISMLDFENPHDRGFGPNHGIHFGLFRVDPADMDKDITIQLDHKAYQYYIEIFRKEILPGSSFSENFIQCFRKSSKCISTDFSSTTAWKRTA